MYDKLIRNINKKHTYDEFVEFVEIYKNIANKAGQNYLENHCIYKEL